MMDQLSEPQKELLRRMRPGIWYFDNCAMKGIQTQTVNQLVNLGYMKTAVDPERDDNGNPLPDWKETRRYYRGYQKIKEVEGDREISPDDLVLLKRLCAKYGNKFVSYYSNSKVWLTRKEHESREDERRESEESREFLKELSSCKDDSERSDAWARYNSGKREKMK